MSRTISGKMHLLPLLLLLAGARVEGGRETGGVEELQMDRQVVWVNQQEKDNLEEEKLPKAQGKMKDTNCSQLLESFSESSSNFTRCANQYAKPIFMCRNCLEDYLTVIEIYEALEHSAEEGVNCKDLLTSRDKVEIVKATFAYIAGKDGLWNRASCDSCYTKPLNHTSNLTETTVEFFALYASTQACFSAHPNQSLTLNKSEACTECQGDYDALSDFYRERVFSQFPLLSGICFDVLDAMNATQREWGSGHFQCGRRMGGSLPLLAAVFCILLSPVVFYLTARFSQEAAGERTVVQRNHITDLIARARRQFNQYRRPSEPVGLLEEDGMNQSGSYDGSPEVYTESPHGESTEGSRRFGEERREIGDGEQEDRYEDQDISVHLESRGHATNSSREEEAEVISKGVDG